MHMPCTPTHHHHHHNCHTRRSKTIQNLPPVLFTLMKSTEPHSDSYYSTDLEGIMRNAGLTNVQYQASDHRHRVVLGTA